MCDKRNMPSYIHTLLKCSNMGDNARGSRGEDLGLSHVCFSKVTIKLPPCPRSHVPQSFPPPFSEAKSGALTQALMFILGFGC